MNASKDYIIITIEKVIDKVEILLINACCSLSYTMSRKPSLKLEYLPSLIMS
jgi:hypothetical protein